MCTVCTVCTVCIVCTVCTACTVCIVCTVFTVFTVCKYFVWCLVRCTNVHSLYVVYTLFGECGLGRLLHKLYPLMYTCMALSKKPCMCTHTYINTNGYRNSLERPCKHIWHKTLIFCLIIMVSTILN